MLELNAGGFLSATPAGVYYATRSDDVEPGRTFLFRLLSREPTPALDAVSLRELAHETGESEALELLHRLQKMALVQRDAAAKRPPAGSLETLLPPLLASLSGDGKALLADDQGFYIATAGFPHETAEELSALSADLASLHARHAGLLRRNLGLRAANWGLIDAAGNAEVGVWNLHLGRQRLALVISGVPQFNQPAFVDLAWLLVRRYAQETPHAPALARA